MKYRNRIPEPGTTISGFADNEKKQSPQKNASNIWFVNQVSDADS
jgi:hypothetical protein